MHASKRVWKQLLPLAIRRLASGFSGRVFLCFSGGGINNSVSSFSSANFTKLSRSESQFPFSRLLGEEHSYRTYSSSNYTYIDIAHQRNIKSKMSRPQPRYPSMMHLMTRGTFYDVGYNVGQTFSDRIKNFYEDCELQMMDFYESPAGREFYEEHVEVCQACYPQYIRELQGMADGAGVPFEHVFMANVFERTLIPHNVHQQMSASTNSLATAELSVDAMGCTALFLVDEDSHRYILHNEDGWSESKWGYIVSAEIEEEDYESESFTSYCYPGILPNWAYGFNKHGLTFNINAMNPVQLIRDAPGAKFITRSLVRARNVEEVIKMVKNSPHGAGFGFTVNISSKDGRMTSVEVGPGKPEAQVHVHDIIAAGEKAEAPTHYYHFNAYKQLNVPEGGPMIGSARRLERTQALPHPCDVPSGLKVMADDNDPLWPIFRTPRPTDNAETVCTALSDVTEPALGCVPRQR